ncbi:MAG: hypothetical protein HGA22_01365, partial [Clostridiales bacterium]|nr:hypothetical protein [Clostridiales bacterium]
MKRFLRILSVLVVITLLPVSGLTACMNKKSVNYKDIGKAAIVSTDGKALPDRPYVIEKETEPEKLTLQEFLTSDKTTIKAFTLSNEIENTLMSAATLTDVIHSRSETQGLKSFQAEVKALIASYGQQKVLELSGKSVSIEELKKIDAKITQLFASRPGVVSVYSGPIKGTWTTPDKVILRWTPENEWIPDGGYDVFRTISGKSEKIAAGLGGEKTISLLASGGKDYAGVIKTVYDNAKLDSSEISMLGYASVEDFNKKVYSKGIVNSTKTRITGDLDYKLQLDERISIPGSMKERMPASDSYSASAFHLAKDIDALPSLIKAGSAVGTSSLNSGVSAINSGSGSVSIAQDELTTEGRLTKKLELPEVKAASVDAKALKISEVLDARNNIMTKALMDPEFASDSGLGCEDDLQAVEGLKIEDPIEYSVVPVGDTAMDLQTVKKLAAGEKLDKEYRISIKYGVETKLETPQGLDGYGMDNVVSLRWQAPANDYDRSVVSGYNIERKKKGESGFTRINGLPVAISYNEDENGILYEVPVFYMDRDLKNGDEATYRIQSLDIFGRVSEYSADLEIKVCKVAPPTAPSVGEPDLSSKVAKNKERSPLSYSDLISFNSKKKGVILPIGRVTDDTEVFVIYRCKALGTGAFDMPQEQVRINVEPYITDDKPRVATSTIRSRFLINPKTPAQTDAIYYDTAIEPGYYYKYWVSAVDSWGNESEWSESKTIGYPLTDAPAEVLNPQASMKKNELVTDKSIVPPGFY